MSVCVGAALMKFVYRTGAFMPDAAAANQTYPQGERVQRRFAPHIVLSDARADDAAMVV